MAAEPDDQCRPALRVLLGRPWKRTAATRCGGSPAAASARRGRRWYDPDFNNFGPRVGFAWAPARFKDKTVIRGGFGMFYGPGQNDDVFAPIDNAGSRIALDA